MVVLYYVLCIICMHILESVLSVVTEFGSKIVRVRVRVSAYVMHKYCNVGKT